MSYWEIVPGPTGSVESTAPAVLRGVAVYTIIGWSAVIGMTQATSASGEAAAQSFAARQLTSCTDAGRSQEPGAEQVAGINELRQLTAFTWDKVAELFGVSRRAVHHWASGKPMAEENDEHLQRCLGCLREVDRGDAVANRHALLATGSGGVTAFDMLARKRYDSVVEMLGRAVDATRTTRAPVQVPVDRLPPPPNVLADARDDISFREAGTPRPLRVVRRTRGA